MTDRYVFPVTAAEVIDGDTYRLTMDPGFRLTTLQPVRLDGWDTPEKSPRSGARPTGYFIQGEKDAALRAQQLAESWFSGWLMGSDTPVWCRTRKDPDSFGRWLGNIWAVGLNGVSYPLGTHLAEHDLAAVWPQRWWEVYGI